MTREVGHQMAIELAWRWAHIEGAHHKQWLIDQMVRELLGAGYDGFVKRYNESGATWDTGIAP